MKSAAYWIEKLALEKHPEGGDFRESYRSAEIFPGGGLPERFSGNRSFSTAIYFLLEGGDFSALHRIRSDELWHFYEGSSLTVHVVDPQGVYTPLRLGSDSEKGENRQVCVPAMSWFGATVDDPHGYSLVGCTVAPGFEFADFEMGRRENLTRLFPHHKALIERLTVT